MGKPILCLDFDGVIHSYASGWKGANIIPDAPVDGALVFILGALEQFTVVVFSSRSNQPKGIGAMQRWLSEAFMDELEFSRAEANETVSKIEWRIEKPPALVTLDDRALTFTGEWPSLDELRNFKPWNKK